MRLRLQHLTLILTILLAWALCGCAALDLISNPVKFITELFVGPPDAKPFSTDDDLLTPAEMADRRAWCAKYAVKTPTQRVQSLCGTGAILGIVLVVGAAIATLVAKLSLDKAIQIALVGVILLAMSIWLEKYLDIILVIVAVAGGVVAVILVRRNWVKLRAMTLMTKEVIKQGHLDNDAVHAAATKAIGPQGSKLRENIKATVAVVGSEK